MPILPLLAATLWQAAALPVAMAPVAGERVSLEQVPAYEALDAALRRAAAEVADVELQPADVTRAHLSAVRDNGIDCDLADAACLSKVAVLAGVDRLVVPLARRSGSVFRLRLLVVDAAGRWDQIEGDIPFKESAAKASGKDQLDVSRDAARSVAERALQLELQAPVAVPAPAVAPPPPPPQQQPPQPAPAPVAEAAPVPVLGLVLAGGGAAALVGGLVGVVWMNEALATPEPFADRQPKLAAGQLSAVAAVAGAATAALGLVVIALD